MSCRDVTAVPAGFSAVKNERSPEQQVKVQSAHRKPTDGHPWVAFYNARMSTPPGSKQILIHGLIFILIGLLWGLVIPHTPYPRLALGAHTQFEGSGILYIVVAILLLKLPNNVGRKSIAVMLEDLRESH